MYSGRTFLSLYITPITFEILFDNILMAFFQDRFSSNIVLKKLKCSTFSISTPFIDNVIAAICFCFLLKIIDFVFFTLRDNLLNFIYKLIFPNSELISLSLVAGSKSSKVK